MHNFTDSISSGLCTVLALFSLYQTAFMYWVLVTLSVEVELFNTLLLLYVFKLNILMVK